MNEREGYFDHPARLILGVVKLAALIIGSHYYASELMSDANNLVIAELIRIDWESVNIGVGSSAVVTIAVLGRERYRQSR